MCIRDSHHPAQLLYPKVIGSPFGAAGLESVLNEIANIKASKEATKTLNFLNIFEKKYYVLSILKKKQI